MNAHIIDLADTAARLSIRCRQLVIQREGLPSVTLPLSNVAAVLLTHPQVTCTQPVLAGLLEEGAVIVISDERRLPVGMSIPLAANGTQTERLIAQANCSVPLRKRLWADIVKSKIAHQANCLQRLRGHDFGLRGLARTVRSGDPQNVESQAARRYWKALFLGTDFRRDPESADQNMLLNYGYAVLRALTARAICAAGLHPSLGLHHRNRYNPFCLADDLMEPFRPLVDALVAKMTNTVFQAPSLTVEMRTRLLQGILGPFQMNGERRTLFDALSQISSALVKCYRTGKGQLPFPNEYCSDEVSRASDIGI